MLGDIVYRGAEALLGRDSMWKLGRAIYLRARREERNEPSSNGEYELLRWLASDQPVRLIDIGANLGEWSAVAAGHFPHAALDAFEPSPGQADHIEAHVPRCRVHRQAVANQPGVVRFDRTGDATGNGRIASGDIRGDVIEVPCVTLDDFLGNDEALLVKIDTEGNDANVIEGAARAIADGRIGVIQFEYNCCWIDFGRNLKQVFAMVPASYALGWLNQDGIELFDEWHFELDRFIERNLVIIRRDLLPRLPTRSMRIGGGNAIEPSPTPTPR